MMNGTYFKNISTLEQLRTAYHCLIRNNHPDNGGTWTGKDFAAMTKEYKAFFKELEKWDTTHTREDATAAERNKYNKKQDQAIRRAMRKVVHLNGINIEIVGSWIWIDGNTYECRDYLKSIGYTWSKSRKKWHFTPYQRAKWYKGGKMSFDEIRERYGSENATPTGHTPQLA